MVRECQDSSEDQHRANSTVRNLRASSLGSNLQGSLVVSQGNLVHLLQGSLEAHLRANLAVNPRGSLVPTPQANLVDHRAALQVATMLVRSKA